MKVDDIKTLNQAQNYVEGCINDLCEGLSTREETLSYLGEYTARLMQLWAENVIKNPSLLGLKNN